VFSPDFLQARTLQSYVVAAVLSVPISSDWEGLDSHNADYYSCISPPHARQTTLIYDRSDRHASSSTLSLGTPSSSSSSLTE
jgi:hypothetical protein